MLSPGPALESTFHPPQMLAAVPVIAMALEQTSTPVAVLDDGENNMVESFAPVVERLAGK